MSSEVAVEVDVPTCQVCGDEPVAFVLTTTAGETESWCAPCVVGEFDTLVDFVVSLKKIGVKTEDEKRGERDALRALRMASEEVLRNARYLSDASLRIVESVENGYGTSFGSSQACFDLAKSCEKRDAAATRCVELGIDRDAIALASKGEK